MSLTRDDRRDLLHIVLFAVACGVAVAGIMTLAHFLGMFWMTDENGDIGPIERSTHADIDRMGDLSTGTRATLAQLALLQSRSLDRLATANVDPAKLSALSKVFLTTLAELKKNEAADEDLIAFRKWVRTQMGNASDPWAGKFGGEAGADQRSVSPAVDAVAEIRGGRVDGNRPGD